MIPADVASSLRQILPDTQSAATNPQTQPVIAAQKLADVLSNLAPGQRLMAEIQALLPNGTYRALVAQREITLALPFSAKPGDSLELEVKESDGHLTLAVVTDKNAAGAKTGPQESVSTSLSQTGKMIGNLISGNGNQGESAPPVPLNGSQALVESMPDTAAELAPVLKQAITQSGMFYEAHQAKWVAGELPTAALKQEPQGKLPVAPSPGGDAAAVHSAIEAKTALVSQTPSAINAEHAVIRSDSFLAAGQNTSAGSLPDTILPIVRQQLDGLANNNFAWQGQIWPGQQMQWEIGEPPERRTMATSPDERVWQSRLKMTLPMLGDIDATIRLQPDGKIALDVSTGTADSADQLRSHVDQLSSQFSAANLELVQVQFRHERPEE